MAPVKPSRTGFGNWSSRDSADPPNLFNRLTPAPPAEQPLDEVPTVPEETPSNKVQEILELSEADPTMVTTPADVSNASVTFDWGLLGNFFVLMIVCAITGHLLERVYRRCGFSLSNGVRPVKSSYKSTPKE